MEFDKTNCKPKLMYVNEVATTLALLHFSLSENIISASYFPHSICRKSRDKMRQKIKCHIITVRAFDLRDIFN